VEGAGVMAVAAGVVPGGGAGVDKIGAGGVAARAAEKNGGGGGSDGGRGGVVVAFYRSGAAFDMF
jgi:hypothetical protein